ncbi:MAG: hypothetical protein ACXVC0_20580, partial [Bdellovibrionota bacterium]
MKTGTFFALFLTLSPGAFAAQTDQEVLLAPAASTSAAPETTPAAPHRISLGLGSGVNAFGGNIGKLYSHSSAVMEIRGEWAFSSAFSARASADAASYAFNAAPNGAVEVNTKALQAAAQWHYLSTGLANSGFDPYASAGMAQVFRTQTFQSFNVVEKDNALAATLGLGTNYALAGNKLGFWMEADASDVFFQDRYSQQYLASGLEDTNNYTTAGSLAKIASL